jgi:DNA-binding CsgD family transcriptional regulator
MVNVRVESGVVLTADLVNSTRFSSEETNEKLSGLLKRLRSEKEWLLSPEIYRGDSFQGVLVNIDQAIRASVLSRALLKATGSEWDLRIALGLGKIDRLTNRPGTSDGEAFRLSGRLADVMKKDKARIALALPVASDPLSAVLTLLESVLEKWTAAQAAVMVGLLTGAGMKEIAEMQNISQSAVSQHAAAARWWAVEPLLNHFGSLVKAFYPYD